MILPIGSSEFCDAIPTNESNFWKGIVNGSMMANGSDFF